MGARQASMLREGEGEIVGKRNERDWDSATISSMQYFMSDVTLRPLRLGAVLCNAKHPLDRVPHLVVSLSSQLLLNLLGAQPRVGAPSSGLGY